jgi:NH3-dependent NAD+ synthetase
MALSNKFGWLVLTTGNKSETSVGYSTLYGDTAGGFAVLKDVYKTQVYALAQWRNAIAPVIPENTITRAPSRGAPPDQTDQDSLPPYDTLDAILREYVEEDRSIAEIARRARRGARASRRAHGGRRRVQAPPEPARHQDHAARIRQGPKAADHESLAGIARRAREKARRAVGAPGLVTSGRATSPRRSPR